MSCIILALQQTPNYENINKWVKIQSFPSYLPCYFWMYCLVELFLHLPAGKCDLQVCRVMPSTNPPCDHHILMNDLEVKRQMLKKSGSAMSDEHNVKENNPLLEQELDWGLGRGRARESWHWGSNKKASINMPLNMDQILTIRDKDILRRQSMTKEK